MSVSCSNHDRRVGIAEFSSDTKRLTEADAAPTQAVDQDGVGLEVQLSDHESLQRIQAGRNDGSFKDALLNWQEVALEALVEPRAATVFDDIIGQNEVHHILTGW